MPPPIQAESPNQNGRILLAAQAFKLGQFKSFRKAAASYDVPKTSLISRINGMTSRRDSIPNSCKLTPQEEATLVQYILELDSRGFSPRL